MFDHFSCLSDILLKMDLLKMDLFQTGMSTGEYHTEGKSVVCS